MFICPKGNVIALLKFEITYYESAVQWCKHYPTMTPPRYLKKYVYPIWGFRFGFLFDFSNLFSRQACLKWNNSGENILKYEQIWTL